MTGTRTGEPRGYFENEAALSRFIQEYDEQGYHRTGSPVDAACASWLAEKLQDCRHDRGVDAKLESFNLDRIDPGPCYLQVDGRRIEGVPAFDRDLSMPCEIRGRLGPAGGDAEIALLTQQASVPGGPGNHSVPKEAGFHRAFVLATAGKTPGLSLSNAPNFHAPAGPPLLQVSGTDSGWLQARAEAGQQAELVLNVARVPAQAANVVVRISGSDPDRKLLVVTTPRSGWWNCAGERAGGLACWLSAISAVAQSRPGNDCLFVAFSGHELGLLGAKAFLQTHGDTAKSASFWVHFGANLGAARYPIIMQASDGSVRDAYRGVLARHEVPLSPPDHAESSPRGEAAVPHQLGVPYVAPISGSDVFHHQADRWPCAIDASVLFRCITAFTEVVLDRAKVRQKI